MYKWASRTQTLNLTGRQPLPNLGAILGDFGQFFEICMHYILTHSSYIVAPIGTNLGEPVQRLNDENLLKGLT